VLLTVLELLLDTDPLVDPLCEFELVPVVDTEPELDVDAPQKYTNTLLFWKSETVRICPAGIKSSEIAIGRLYKSGPQPAVF